VIAVRYMLVRLPAIVLALLLLSTGSPRAAVAIRGHHPPAAHHPGGAHHPHYPAYYHGYYGHPYYGYPYYPYASFGFSFGYPYYGYPYYPYAYGGAPYYAGPPADLGFIDTDVSPERAMVYVDGEYVGSADDFDGYPRYLSVEPGEHTLSFQAEGYHAATKTVKVPQGALLRFDMALQKPGKNSPPPKDDDAKMIVPPPRPVPQPSAESGAQGGVALAPDEEGDEAPKGQPGTMKLHVVPGDASIYLDGEFIGTGDSLARLHGSLRLDPGRHVVEVARPGYRTEKKDLTVKPGSHAPLEILLDKD